MCWHPLSVDHGHSEDDVLQQLFVALRLKWVYSHFMISSPDCALHTALAHVINVLGIVESQSSWETPPFQCFNHVSDCSVQCAIWTRNRELTVGTFLDTWSTLCWPPTVLKCHRWNSVEVSPVEQLWSNSEAWIVNGRGLTATCHVHMNDPGDMRLCLRADYCHSRQHYLSVHTWRHTVHRWRSCRVVTHLTSATGLCIVYVDYLSDGVVMHTVMMS